MMLPPGQGGQLKVRLAWAGGYFHCPVSQLTGLVPVMLSLSCLFSSFIHLKSILDAYTPDPAAGIGVRRDQGSGVDEELNFASIWV